MIKPQIGQRWLRKDSVYDFKFHYIMEIQNISPDSIVEVIVVVDFDSSLEYRQGYKYSSICLQDILISGRANDKFTYLKGQDKV